MKYSKEELCLIWLDSFIGLEYKHKKEIYQRIVCSSKIKEAIVSLKEYITANIGENEYNLLYSSATDEYLKFILEPLEKSGAIALTLYSKDYPNSLKEIEFPPLVLYAKGDISLLNKNSIAIVGSRKAIESAKAFTKDLTKSLINADVVVVTGTADGIDATVIKTALELDAPVIVVVAGGFNHIYPQTNVELVERTTKKGLIISENPLDVKPMPYFFPIRNRIIAGLSMGTIVTSAGIKSGALYTAEYALSFSKDVFAVPYSVGVKTGEGTNDLIKKGALLIDSAKDVLDFYGLKTQEVDDNLTDIEKQILSLLENEELHIEVLAQKLNKQPFEIISIMQILEIKGLVFKNGTNEYGSIK